MYKLKLLGVLAIFVIGGSVFGQEEDYSRDEKVKQPAKNIDRRFNFGGNFGMQFGSQTFIEFSPKVAYSVTQEFIVGGGITYIYMRQDWTKLYGYGGINESSIYGGSIYSNYLLFENFFPHVEFELLNFEYYNNITKEISRKWISSFFVGAGYRQRLGVNSYIQIMLLYNLNHQTLSPYASPFVTRIGIYL